MFGCPIPCISYDTVDRLHLIDATNTANDVEVDSFNSLHLLSYNVFIRMLYARHPYYELRHRSPGSSIYA